MSRGLGASAHMGSTVPHLTSSCCLPGTGDLSHPLPPLVFWPVQPPHPNLTWGNNGVCGPSSPSIPDWDLSAGEGRGRVGCIPCSISGQSNKVAISALGWLYCGVFHWWLGGNSPPHQIPSMSHYGDNHSLDCCLSTVSWGCQLWEQGMAFPAPAGGLLGSTNHVADPS